MQFYRPDNMTATATDEAAPDTSNHIGSLNATAEAAVGHRNDKNDKGTPFSFSTFRRDLSALRQSQQVNPDSWHWSSSDSSSDTEEQENEETEEDESLHATKEEVDNSADLSLTNQAKHLFGRRKNPARSVGSSESKASSVASFTLQKSNYEGGIYCSSNSDKEQIIQLSRVMAFTNWARSLHHLDPRYMILNFFNDLALQGMKNLASMGGIIPAEKRHEIPFILRVFNRAGVFSVWRPTSMDAIKKIMTGEGVGKGLDIKGKSALRGKYSGFVPFMQISKNEDKAKVCSMTTDGRVRIFYPNQDSRDKAAILMKPLRDLMVNRTTDSIKIIKDTEEMEAKVLNYSMQMSFKNMSAPSQRPTLAQMKQIVGESRRLLNTGPLAVDREKFRKALKDKHDSQMSDHRIHKIDNGEGVFGLDIPEKLFWEAFIAKSDITREKGSEHDTGRPSMPEFQTMNFETLRKKPQRRRTSSLRSEPRPVLYHAGCGSKDGPYENANPLCPLGLLMAYEEACISYCKVTPVVSDFDCFLVGTRGVEFHEPLGEQELSMLTMCVDDIEEILSSPKAGIGWTKRWLKVKKKHICKTSSSQEMPKFGYADPTSYTMMNGAVHRLKCNGAVRHGPECFNYGFPQELDDQYLVISDTLPGQVPWKYVNSSELIAILSEKIDEGFTFPMNPKWILCDPGFKPLYDKLLTSDTPTVQESMSIWYPQDIRERIHEISTKWPLGFDQSTVHQEQTSGVSVDLAQMELERYQRRQRFVHKARRALLKEKGPTGKDHHPTFFSSALEMLRIGKAVDKKKSNVTKSGNPGKGLGSINEMVLLKEAKSGNRRGHRFDNINGIKRRATIECTPPSFGTMNENTVGGDKGIPRRRRTHDGNDDVASKEDRSESGNEVTNSSRKGGRQSKRRSISGSSIRSSLSKVVNPVKRMLSHPDLNLSSHLNWSSHHSRNSRSDHS